MKYLIEIYRYLKFSVVTIFPDIYKPDIIFINYNRKNNIDDKNVNPHLYLLDQATTQYRTIIVDPHDIIENVTDYNSRVLNFRPTYFMNRLKSVFIRFSRADEEVFDKITNLIKIEFSIQIDIRSIAKEVFATQIQHHKQYLKLFKKYQSKLIIFCDDGSMKGMISAAKIQGIRTIDYQHSLISPLNILYNYSNKVPLKYIQSTVPDYFFSFGEFWDEEIKFPVKKIFVGFQFFDKMKAKYPEVEQHLRAKNIIFISGGPLSMKIFTTIASRLSELLPEYKIFYKLRIEEYDGWCETYPESFQKKKNIHVICDNNKTLYEYFSLCAYQIGVNSTALYEGLAFDLTTFIIKAGWYQEMERLYIQKLAFLVDSAEEIYQIIKSNLLPQNRMDKNNRIFKKNSTQNIQQAIKSLI